MLKQDRFQTETPNVIDPGECPPSRPGRRIQAETMLPRQKTRQSNYTRQGNKGSIAKGIPLRFVNDSDDDDDCSFYDDCDEQQGLFQDEHHDDDKEDESGIAQARLFANAMIHEKRQRSKRDLMGLVKRASSFRNSNRNLNGGSSHHSIQHRAPSIRALSLKNIGKSSSHRSIPLGSNSSDKNIWLVDHHDDEDGGNTSKQRIYILLAVVVTLLVAMLFALTVFQWRSAKLFPDPKGDGNLVVDSNRLEEMIDYLGDEDISSPQGLYNSTSPQHKAAMWLSSDDLTIPFNTHDHQAFVQRYALLVLYFALGGDSWTNDYHFASHDQHECSWFERVLDSSTEEMDGLYSVEESHHYLAMGVSCDNELRVTSILLPSNNLEGSFPSELQYLRMLETLDLRHNSIGGSLPTELENLVHLTYLDLSNNALTGPVMWLPNKLSHLELVDLSNNQLDLNRNNNHSVPRDPRLKTLLLGGNNPNSNTTSYISDEIRYFTNLKLLSLDNSNLGGTIPEWIWYELPNLQFLDLSHNQLIGNIGTESMDSLQNLQALLLHDNPLTGTLPEYIGLLPNLATVTIHHTNMHVGEGAANRICWQPEESMGLESLTTDCGDESCPCCMENCCNGDDCYRDVDWNSMAFLSGSLDENNDY